MQKENKRPQGVPSGEGEQEKPKIKVGEGDLVEPYEVWGTFKDRNFEGQVDLAKNG